MGREIKHFVAFDSLVSWRCVCGGAWRNDKLKGKSDADLVIEREEAFTQHLRDMQLNGY